MVINILPMKKNYQFAKIALLPKKSTIDFILNFSKSINSIKVSNLSFFISKN